MIEMLKNLHKDESGQDLIEYALLAALIASGIHRRHDDSSRQGKLGVRHHRQQADIVGNQPLGRPVIL